MPSEETPASRNRKRQLCNKAEPTTDSPPPPTAKRRKLEIQQQYRTPSSFWDNLSRQWLTRRALREFDRRTVWPATPVPPDLTDKENIQVAQLKRFARHGGPILGSIRAYPEPGTATPSHQTMNSSQPDSRKRARTGIEPDTSSKSRRTSAYDPAFKQHLIDHGVYPEGYGGLRNVQEPHNWEEIQARLAMPRGSLSPSRFGREAFWNFKEKNEDALTENTVTSKVFPIIAGTTNIPSEQNLLFGNLKDLTDGSIAKAKPDFYDGTRPDELHKQIRADLGPYIVPSKKTTAPCLPNFFTEAKESDGSPAVCKLQALYDGALGARGVHELRSYVDGEASYDNNAYTITSTYHGGTGDLTIYSTHPILSNDPQIAVEYRTTQLRGWKMTDAPNTFRQGASALRNARDWAQEQRKAIVAAANEKRKDPIATGNGKALNTESSELDSSTHSILSPSTNELVDQESDTSTDELALETAANGSSIYRSPVEARKNSPLKASSIRRKPRGPAPLLDDPRDESSSRS